MRCYVNLGEEDLFIRRYPSFTRRLSALSVERGRGRQCRSAARSDACSSFANRSERPRCGPRRLTSCSGLLSGQLLNRRPSSRDFRVVGAQDPQLVRQECLVDPVSVSALSPDVAVQWSRTCVPLSGAGLSGRKAPISSGKRSRNWRRAPAESPLRPVQEATLIRVRSTFG